ncbi:hypothetical protein PV327_007349 [Microctonus hyperodae]|uniref:Uncharacterized protein n=1 Tax=Microctonus hyperodae TaxID=165561 RepID=A0AA39FZ82_MICHY|nr:hypothetical protein PV327_007349 [Microctonus hyperodae]
MDAGHLMMITEMTKNNPKEMLRKILIFLIGEEKLANSSALGHGYVMNHGQGVDHTFPFNRVTNQPCASRAVKFGVSTSTDGKQIKKINAQDSHAESGINKVPNIIGEYNRDDDEVEITQNKSGNLYYNFADADREIKESSIDTSSNESDEKSTDEEDNDIDNTNIRDRSQYNV